MSQTVPWAIPAGPVPALGQGIGLSLPRTCSWGQGELDAGQRHSWGATEAGSQEGGAGPRGGRGSLRVLGHAPPTRSLSPMLHRLGGLGVKSRLQVGLRRDLLP